MKTLGRTGGDEADSSLGSSSELGFLTEFEALSVNSEELLLDDPTTYEEAMASSRAELWKEAMRAEYRSLLENGTFQAFKTTDAYRGTFQAFKTTDAESTTISMQLPEANDIYSTGQQIPITVPFGLKPIGCKWVFKSKRNPDGSTRCKVRLVIRGFEQVAGIDFKETYAPVSKLATLRFLLSLAATNKWSIDHMDVVTAFLNPAIDNDNVYMSMPPGIEWLDSRLQRTSTVRLLKALYGLKQAPRLWYQDINHFLLSIGFNQSKADPNLYLKKEFYYCFTWTTS